MMDDGLGGCVGSRSRVVSYFVLNSGWRWLMCVCGFFFLMIRRPPRSTQSRSSAASDVYKRQGLSRLLPVYADVLLRNDTDACGSWRSGSLQFRSVLSLIHISEPTRLLSISYAVFCLKKKKQNINICNTLDLTQ